MLDTAIQVATGSGPVRASQFLTFATRSEELGFESVWIPEHVVAPLQVGGSPRRDVDHLPMDPATPFLDSFVALGHVAGRTQRIGLGTGIFNVALRHPFVVSRAAATLADYAPGRVDIGVGAGWLAGEYEALGLDFASRGSRLDEALEIITSTWRDETLEYRGRHFTFPPVAWQPKPQIAPRLHIAGETRASFRRLARFGTGWIVNGRTPDSVGSAIEQMRQAVGREARDPAELEVTMFVDAHTAVGTAS